MILYALNTLKFLFSQFVQYFLQLTFNNTLNTRFLVIITQSNCIGMDYSRKLHYVIAVYVSHIVSAIRPPHSSVITTVFNNNNNNNKFVERHSAVASEASG